MDQQAAAGIPAKLHWLLKSQLFLIILPFRNLSGKNISLIRSNLSNDF